ncbi:MAG: glycosyltransferase family 9 protein [Bryobacteraceae bacterium]
MSGGGTRSSGARILVVRLGAMGDVIHALPAVATLKQNFPESRVTWVIEPRWTPLVDGNPFVDHVLPIDRRQISSLLRTWRELRSEPYTCAVDFQGLIKSALVARASCAERIFGPHRSQAREGVAALLYTDEVLMMSTHVVDRNLEIAAGAGAAAMVKSFPLPFGLPEGSLPECRFVLASPLSGWRGKQWPIEYYEKVAQRLQQEIGMRLVLNGPPAARDVLSNVAGTLGHYSSIEGLIDATRRATAVIGVDSGPMHLADALGKPGVAIFGPTDPARNGPYRGNLTVLRSPNAVTTYKRHDSIDASMREISPDAVFAALKTRLAGRISPADCRA